MWCSWPYWSFWPPWPTPRPYARWPSRGSCPVCQQPSRLTHHRPRKNAVTRWRTQTCAVSTPTKTPPYCLPLESTPLLPSKSLTSAISLILRTVNRICVCYCGVIIILMVEVKCSVMFWFDLSIMDKALQSLNNKFSCLEFD